MNRFIGRRVAAGDQTAPDSVPLGPLPPPFLVQSVLAASGGIPSGEGRENRQVC